MKFLPTNGVLALIGEETFVFAASGDMVFLNRGTLCGRGGRGDFEVVAMFVCSNHSAPKSSEVLGNPSEYRTSSIERKGQAISSIKGKHSVRWGIISYEEEIIRILSRHASFNLRNNWSQEDHLWLI